LFKFKKKYSSVDILKLKMSIAPVDQRPIYSQRTTAVVRSSIKANNADYWISIDPSLGVSHPF
jgi:hypothetical protein